MLLKHIFSIRNNRNCNKEIVKKCNVNVNVSQAKRKTKSFTSLINAYSAPCYPMPLLMLMTVVCSDSLSTAEYFKAI